MASRLGLLTASLRRVEQIKLMSVTARLASPQMTSFGSGMSQIGTGGAGAVRESGGAFGQREMAFEEQYFRKLTDEQLRNLHDQHVEEIQFLEKQMKDHQAEIERHRKQIQELKKIAQLH